MAVSLSASQGGVENTTDAGWSSLVARWAPNPKVAASNAAPATNFDTSAARRSRAGQRKRPAFFAFWHLGYRSHQVVEHPLDVLVLLQPVDQAEHLGGLILRQLHRGHRDVLRLGGEGGDAAVLQGLLELAEIGEGAAEHELRLPLIAGALAHLLQTVVDQLQLQ